MTRFALGVIIGSLGTITGYLWWVFRPRISRAPTPGDTP